jgi:hypothetical protein
MGAGTRFHNTRKELAGSAEKTLCGNGGADSEGQNRARKKTSSPFSVPYRVTFPK